MHSVVLPQRSRWLSLLLVLVFVSIDFAAESVDFRSEIQPILAEHCYQCHGPDAEQRAADLRLDRPSAELSRRGIIVAGNASESELVKRVLSADPDLKMPPDHGTKPLLAEEIEALKQWIDAGGDFAVHWAFVAPEKAKLPGDESNPLDKFVRAELDKLGRDFSPPESSEVLCRRIYLDVIGLPPTPTEVDEFSAACESSRATATANLIERLQNSEAYGEKWARHWLDVARYSDTNGYEKDLPREQWAWRDWVIGAINRDMPYDQFVIEQVAGDMLPDRTQDQMIASGFLRNGMVNEEGAIVAEQFRIEGNFDRMDCLGKAVLGLTLQCAQCHTHKFDPISHEEYYRVFAFLNDTHESQSWVYSEQQLEQIESVENRCVELMQRAKQRVPDWEAKLLTWAREIIGSQPNWLALHIDEPVWDGGLNHPQTLSDESIVILGHPTTHGFLVLESEVSVPQFQALRLEALLHPDQPFSGPGRSYRGTFAISEIEVEIAMPATEAEEANAEVPWKPLKVASAVADFEEPERELDEYFYNASYDKEKRRRVGPASFLIDGDEKTAWSADRGPIIRHQESAVVLNLSEPCVCPEGTRIRVKIVMKHGGDGNGRDNLQLGRLRLSIANETVDALSIDHGVALTIQSLGDTNDAMDLGDTKMHPVFRAWIASVPGLADINTEMEATQLQFPEAETSVLHLKSTEPFFTRRTELLQRGEWDKPEREVSPGALSALHDAKDVSDRLEFARWLVDRRSPLAARVQVNRTWQAIFGRGLLETSEDFGTRSPAPRYRHLLDWLAVDFMEHGWSQKQLIKTILTSRVYGQSSKCSDELWEADPQNELLARGPRFRVEAEVVRDIALSVSGLLSRQVGGPSEFPPVPQSVIDDNFMKVDYWNEAQGEERYRRSLYLFRKRSMPDPVMSSLDAPNGDSACARRIRSNTPLSALVTLNEPVFVEAARALALRVLREGGNDHRARIDTIYRLCTSRVASDMERDRIQALLDRQLQRLGEGWLSIDSILGDSKDTSEGDWQRLPEGVTPRDWAAWTLVSRVFLSLDETLCKN